MANLVKLEPQDMLSEQSNTMESISNDVQSYLITNYRVALIRGDKSSAKSCLLAARYFSANDQDVNNEIYIMAKADGDIVEASKCFSKIFHDLFISQDSNNATKTITTNELELVVKQTLDETKALLLDLESKYLKLKSSRDASKMDSSSLALSTTQKSPISSPSRSRMMSVDSRESISRLDGRYHAANQKSFYQQLFDNLTEDTKKSILSYSISNCDDPIEKCKLMMLSVSIFNENISTYGSSLLRTLIDLTSPGQSGKKLSTDESMRYAKSLLVLDAIPLVLNLTSITNLEVDINELFERALNFYSDQYLEYAAKEHKAKELHEGMKKSITARILGIENKPISEQLTEDHLVGTLKFLSQKYMENISDDKIKAKFEELRLVFTDKYNLEERFDKLLSVIEDLDLKTSVPDDVLLSNMKESISSQVQVVTPPPKARGRPKKVQQQPTVIVSLDDEVKRQLQNRARELHFVFYTIVQYMFSNCAKYLRSTRSKVLLNINNPLSNHFDTESTKSSSQSKSSRSKSNLQQESSTSACSSRKRIKLDERITKLINIGASSEESPLNTEQTRQMDLKVLATLTQAQKCIDFLNSEYGSFSKLWSKFVESNQTTSLSWYKRICVDAMMKSNEYEKVIDMLSEDDSIKKFEDKNDSKESVLAEIVKFSTKEVAQIRHLVQLVSCHIQLIEKTETFDGIDQLLSRMKQSGLLEEGEFSSETIIDQYLIPIRQPEFDGLGFLLFDSLSMIRYCLGILIDIHKRFTSGSNNKVDDTTIGHAIVLSQFDWPKESHLYDECISWIRSHKPKSTTPQCLSAATKFTYPDFFQYIRNPNIIEDFMAMLSQGYTLEIKGSATNNTAPNTGSQSRTGSSSQGSTGGSRGSASATTTTRSSKMITTRGVNKSFKEDLKVALISQMKNSSIIIPLYSISEFLQEHLIPYLKVIKK